MIATNGYQPRKQEIRPNVPTTDSNVEDIGRCAVLLKLCADKGYNPTDIGCAVLAICGFDVKRYLKGDISVSDNLGHLLYYSDLPDYEP